MQYHRLMGERKTTAKDRTCGTAVTCSFYSFHSLISKQLPGVFKPDHSNPIPWTDKPGGLCSPGGATKNGTLLGD